MNRIAVIGLRVVIVLTLAGTLFVQVWMAPLIWVDLAGAAPSIRTAAVAIFVLGIATLQVCAVCVWQLLALVRAGSVFSRAAFRYVDFIIGAILAAAVLLCALAALLAPGDAAPGLILLIGGAALVVGGVALIVVVLRVLLSQAIALRSELDEVI